MGVRILRLCGESLFQKRARLIDASLQDKRVGLLPICVQGKSGRQEPKEKKSEPVGNQAGKDHKLFDYLYGKAVDQIAVTGGAERDCIFLCKTRGDLDAGEIDDTDLYGCTDKFAVNHAEDEVTC